jgi:hypothetical protein
VWNAWSLCMMQHLTQQHIPGLNRIHFQSFLSEAENKMCISKPIGDDALLQVGFDHSTPALQNGRGQRPAARDAGGSARAGRELRTSPRSEQTQTLRQQGTQTIEKEHAQRAHLVHCYSNPKCDNACKRYRKKENRCVDAIDEHHDEHRARFGASNFGQKLLEWLLPAQHLHICCALNHLTCSTLE